MKQRQFPTVCGYLSPVTLVLHNQTIFLLLSLGHDCSGNCITNMIVIARCTLLIVRARMREANSN